jgi:hypothetical protein
MTTEVNTLLVPDLTKKLVRWGDNRLILLKNNPYRDNRTRAFDTSMHPCNKDAFFINEMYQQCYNNVKKHPYLSFISSLNR